MVETGFLDFPCTICSDFGMWLTPKGDVMPCPVIARGDDHHEPNAAATLVQKAITDLKAQEAAIDSRQFGLAVKLCSYTSAAPCERRTILADYFSYLPMSEANQLRKFHAAIEELRRVWLLPIGSRKDTPSGYWIITDQKDFEEWFDRSKSAPLTQLTTIYKVARRNFPIFAEQIELDIFNNVASEDPPLAA
jgi:hypothetical protein